MPTPHRIDRPPDHEDRTRFPELRALIARCLSALGPVGTGLPVVALDGTPDQSWPVTRNSKLDSAIRPSCRYYFEQVALDVAFTRTSRLRTSSIRANGGIRISVFRCRQWDASHPFGPMSRVPWENLSGSSGASPLRKQLTSRDSPATKAFRSASTLDGEVPFGSRITSRGWRSTSHIVRVPPARR